MSGSQTVPTQGRSRPKGGIPRGLARTGPVIFSYGFRPFFLGGALWAIVAMVLWIAALSGFIDLGGDYGAPNWHAHEMLFGFASAVLAGFLLTAVPNWTGRLPVSGKPLVWLFALWCAGRISCSCQTRWVWSPPQPLTDFSCRHFSRSARARSLQDASGRTSKCWVGYWRFPSPISFSIWRRLKAT